MKTCTERLKETRQERNYTQAQIADKLGIRQNVYSRYEIGKNEIKLKNLITLSKLYETSTDYLLGVTDERKPYSAAKE